MQLLTAKEYQRILTGSNRPVTLKKLALVLNKGVEEEHLVTVYEDAEFKSNFGALVRIKDTPIVMPVALVTSSKTHKHGSWVWVNPDSIWEELRHVVKPRLTYVLD